MSFLNWVYADMLNESDVTLAYHRIVLWIALMFGPIHLVSQGNRDHGSTEISRISIWN